MRRVKTEFKFIYTYSMEKYSLEYVPDTTVEVTVHDERTLDELYEQFDAFVVSCGYQPESIKRVYRDAAENFDLIDEHRANHEDE